MTNRCNLTANNVQAMALIFFMCVANLAFATERAVTNFYGCPSEQDAFSCSACERRAGVRGKFLINVSAQAVLAQFYENGSLVENLALEACKVVDAKNWVCRDEKTYANDGYLNIWHQMIDGTYLRAHESFSPGLSIPNLINTPPSWTAFYYCGK